MRIKANHLLLVINILTAILVLITTFLPDNALRIILGLPLVLFFPGYTLVEALFPRKDSLSGMERLALCFGTSLAIVPLIGLALNFLPWGIHLYPILISLVIFIVAMSIVAWIRGRRIPSEEQLSLQIRFKFPSIPPLWSGQSMRDKIITILLAAIIIGAVGVLAYVINMPRTSERYTEFYILNTEGKAENYPSTIVLGQNARVILGIVNHENTPASYRIEIVIDNENKGEIAAFSLNDEEKWEQMVTFTPAHTGVDQKVEFLLYNGTATDAYETVHLLIQVK